MAISSFCALVSLHGIHERGRLRSLLKCPIRPKYSLLLTRELRSAQKDLDITVSGGILLNVGEGAF